MSEETTNTTTQETTAVLAVQADIQKIESKIADLKADGAELYADAIAALEAKRDALIAQAETEIKTWEQKFREKHGVSVWVATAVGGYIVWQICSAVARALGAM